MECGVRWEYNGRQFCSGIEWKWNCDEVGSWRGNAEKCTADIARLNRSEGIRDPCDMERESMR